MHTGSICFSSSSNSPSRSLISLLNCLIQGKINGIHTFVREKKLTFCSLLSTSFEHIIMSLVWNLCCHSATTIFILACTPLTRTALLGEVECYLLVRTDEERGMDPFLSLALPPLHWRLSPLRRPVLTFTDGVCHLSWVDTHTYTHRLTHSHTYTHTYHCGSIV